MDTNLAATLRQERGKNESRRLRRMGQIPAVVYGDESRKGVSITVDPSAVIEILHSESGVNTLIGLTVDGGKSNKVLVKEFQLDPISNDLLHIDFYKLALDKVLTVTVPIVLTGESLGVKQQGGIVDFVQREVQLECMPTAIPENIEIDVSDLMIGQGVRLRDLINEVEWTPVTDPDVLLVHVVAPKVEEEPTDEEETTDGAVESEAGAEPEVIKKGKTEEDEGSADSK